MPVVLLEEIGLAEESHFNPLQVLHGLLEPTVGGYPPVAVVGISNWALDAAKMNRAIHLTRPEPTVQDLAKTAMSIRDDFAAKNTGNAPLHQSLKNETLRDLAQAYHNDQHCQLYKHLHGLRDYYAFVKYVSIQSCKILYSELGEIIYTGLLRNFGGVELGNNFVIKSFADKVHIIPRLSKPREVQDLIRDNLDDKDARHLMLITGGDSALNILEQTLRGEKYVTMLGSRFENDISEEYNYRTLSEIILCMERGGILILQDLESIYGSLNDMLNQNYTIIGKKRYCRVALGPYSNSMYQVHDDFRCIVLVDEKNLNLQQPPFLNRFEKQILRFSTILSGDLQAAIRYLETWIAEVSCIEGLPFSSKGMFLGLHGDTLPSLVYLRSTDNQQETPIHPSHLADLCKEDLMRVACPDAVLRISTSHWAHEHESEVAELQQKIFPIAAI